ncbi:DUF4139 domain-containing protein [Streptomyces sp. TLI_171]|uniref:DUF4139 domain-containing protein n=1 Tax=Streptomyces sp. TLI_171 TaxID=1938859 RepID=UPI000C40D900|nr:DUF4139 domain-containing protein [Streptomyces sp. TLI_171]RKE21877.1 uncharacterized protein (TIGR02231 family) [Streptomyces sp. TLI_171]
MAGKQAVWESALESVVVHAVGAVCRRRASGVVPADGRVRVAGLPRLAAAGSLRVRVLAGGARVAEARLEPLELVRTAEEKPSWERELARLGEERDRLVERQQRLDARIGEVAGLRPVPPQRRREDGHRRAPADAVLALAEFVDARLAVLQERSVELAQQVREAEHAFDVAVARAERRSSAEQAGGVESSAQAVLTVRGEGPVELEVEYAVPGAVWVPTYRLAHRRGERSAHLVLRASVAQRTGEDWSGVRLALSTADLARPGGLPKLASLRIGRRQEPPAPSGWRAQPAGLDELFGGWQDAQRARPEPPRAVAVAGVLGGAAPAPKRARSAPRPGGAPAGPGFAPQAPQAPGGPPTLAGLALPVAPPMMAPPPMPAPMAPMASRAAYGGAPPEGFGAAPDLAAPAGEPAGPLPSDDQLDYPGLVLAGPEEDSFRRGRLFPGAGRPAAAGALHGAEAVGRLPLPQFAARPRESAGSFDHRYDAAAPAEIPSDGVWHTVAVAELPVGVETRYVCVPSVEEAVYAVLELANGTAHALLAGPVEVSVDGDFLLTAALPTLAPGGVRELGLGRSEEVRVARHSEVRESTSGVLNSTTVLDHGVRVELVNRLPHEASVEVRERVPVSGDPDVRIEERPGWSRPEEPSAQLPSSARIRRVVVPPGGSAELTGGYVIRIPAGKAVVGGNRRS